MRRLPEVKEAKDLMTEAMDWSVIRWLFEKRRVRKVADQANAVLDRLDEEVKAAWNEDLKFAYDELPAQDGHARRKRRPLDKQHSHKPDPQVRLLAKELRDADDEAWRARMDAEDTFDEADRQMSTSLAQEGCKKAIHSWTLHEKAIRKSEAVISATRSAG